MKSLLSKNRCTSRNDLDFDGDGVKETVLLVNATGVGGAFDSKAFIFGKIGWRFRSLSVGSSWTTELHQTFPVRTPGNPGRIAVFRSVGGNGVGRSIIFVVGVVRGRLEEIWMSPEATLDGIPKSDRWAPVPPAITLAGGRYQWNGSCLVPLDDPSFPGCPSPDPGGTPAAESR